MDRKTNAIKENLILKEITANQAKHIYASEAEILNVALFGQTSKEFKEENLKFDGNLRDYANVIQLVCLSNLESINSIFIKDGLSQGERLIKLNKIAIEQMSVLISNSSVKKLESNEKIKKLN